MYFVLQVHSKQTHSGIMTGVSYSPDGAILASTAKDGSLKLYASSTFEEVATVAFSGGAMGCAFSPDGTSIAVPLHRDSDALAIVDTGSWSIRNSGLGTAGLNICVTWSPDGQEVATAGDNSRVTLWNSSSCSVSGQLVGHQGWVWCVRYTLEGDKLLSCSSDR